MSVNEHAQPIVGDRTQAGSEAAPEKPATPTLTDAREARCRSRSRLFYRRPQASLPEPALALFRKKAVARAAVAAARNDFADAVADRNANDEDEDHAERQHRDTPVTQQNRAGRCQ